MLLLDVYAVYYTCVCVLVGSLIGDTANKLWIPLKNYHGLAKELGRVFEASMYTFDKTLQVFITQMSLSLWHPCDNSPTYTLQVV